MSLEDETHDPEVFCALLDDSSSFLLSLELDLDLCLLLSLDRDSTLSREETEGCCGLV